MKFGNYVTSLFLIFKTFFYLVNGQTMNGKEKSDCTKLYNFLNGDTKDYANSCCKNIGIDCDKEEQTYITSLTISDTINTIKANLDSFPYFSRIESL